MYDVPVSVETRCAGEEKAYARGVNLHVVDAACSVARLEVVAGDGPCPETVYCKRG
ncbi:MAG: hypothetical protein ACOY46_14925 [Bacillota bacterium]